MRREFPISQKYIEPRSTLEEALDDIQKRIRKIVKELENANNQYEIVKATLRVNYGKYTPGTTIHNPNVPNRCEIPVAYRDDKSVSWNLVEILSFYHNERNVLRTELETLKAIHNQ